MCVVWLFLRIFKEECFGHHNFPPSGMLRRFRNCSKKRRMTFASVAAPDDVSESGEVNWGRHVSHVSYQTVTYQANGLYFMVCELVVL